MIIVREVLINEAYLHVETVRHYYDYDQDLPDYWAANRAALIEYTAMTHAGITGFVR